MTKAELIRRISKRAGVPDSEAKVFFEIFLKKSSDLLSPGEAVFLKGFGHFQLRKGKIRTSISETENFEKDSVFVELMVYYPIKLHEEELKKEIIFNVPVVKFENYNPLDSYFSLSIGKPVIPIKGLSNSDFFIPLTGQELRKLVEGRVDKLLVSIDIVKEYTKGNEVLIIDTSSIKSHQLEFNWGEVPSKNISDSKLTAKSKDVENEINESTEKEISWKFGDDISKEIVEESILDVDKEETSIAEEEFKEEIEEDKTDWNFGVTIADEDESDSEINSIVEENAGELYEDQVEANVPEPVAEKDDFEQDEEIDPEEQFERVRSFSSYFEKDDVTKLSNPSAYRYLRGTDTLSYEDFEPDPQTDLETFEAEAHLEDSGAISTHKDEKKMEREYKDEDNISEVKTVTEDNEINTQSDTIEEQIDNSDKPRKNETRKLNAAGDKVNPVVKSKLLSRLEERESYYSREGAFPVFIIALIVIIAIAVALYFYLNNVFVSSKNPESKQLTQSKVIHPNVIERDYTVPVTYPYKNEFAKTKPNEEAANPEITADAKTPGKEQPDINKSGGNRNVMEPGKNNRQAENQNDASSFTFESLPPPINTNVLDENISQTKDKYTVQVSSWQSKSVADQQAAKFKAKGFDAFVEMANIPGKGIWYRVKIKNFKSIREAEDFLLSNQY